MFDTEAEAFAAPKYTSPTVANDSTSKRPSTIPRKSSASSLRSLRNEKTSVSTSSGPGATRHSPSASMKAFASCSLMVSSLNSSMDTTGVTPCSSASSATDLVVQKSVTGTPSTS